MFGLFEKSIPAPKPCPACAKELSRTEEHVYCSWCGWNVALVRKEMRSEAVVGLVYFPLWVGFVCWITGAGLFGVIIFTVFVAAVVGIQSVRTLLALPKAIASTTPEFSARQFRPALRFQLIPPTKFDRFFPWVGYAVGLVGAATFLVAAFVFMRDPDWRWESIFFTFLPLLFAVLGVASVGSRSLERKKEERLVRSGEIVEGVVVYGRRGKGGPTYTYEYFVSGRRFTGTVHLGNIEEGDPLQIIYDPQNPEDHSVIHALTFFRVVNS